MRIGIYGGAFDPVHWGHLLLAETCFHEARLDLLFFVPTGSSPHRSGKDSYNASAENRFEMLRLAVEDYREFQISRFEIDRKEKSYTVETLRYFKDRFAAENPELFFLVGADTFYDLPNWYDILKILRLATPLVACRPGCLKPDIDILKSMLPQKDDLQLRMLSVKMPQIDLSSSRIRKQLAMKQSIRFQVPKEVESYIKENNLYQKTP